MHGCANDYVVVAAYEGELAARFAGAAADQIEPLARRLCDRRTGVGADGFVVVVRETRPDSPARFEMRMHNPDGSYSPMCGNALRCVAKHLIDSGAAPGDEVVVRTGGTIAPMLATRRDAAGRVAQIEADLGPPVLDAAAIPCRLPTSGTGRVLDAPLAVGGREFRASAVSMGNPHCVLFVDEPADDALVHGFGPQIERHGAFPERTNTEFVYCRTRTRLVQRTWERGAGETHACGSGACAVAVAGVLTGRTERRVTIELLGGALSLHWREADSHVLMTGPAVEVFRGEVD